MNEDASDETLMLRYQSGDAAAFDELYARHRGGLYRFILRQGRLGDHAEELFQDVWMNLIKARATYRVEAQFRTWLYTLARNRVLDFFRSDGRAGAVMREAGEDEDLENVAGSRVAQPDVLSESREQGDAIVKLLETLPAPQRETFLMYQEGGLSIEEIAAATGTTFEAAKSRLRYAVARLRDGLQEYR
jgi:RNA polymerase sigma-70 factor (ECF subfamily)